MLLLGWRFNMARCCYAYATAQTPAVDVPITVGEIDFGTGSNVTITGPATLTLRQASGSAFLDVGQTFANAGTDVITATLAFPSGGAVAVGRRAGG